MNKAQLVEALTTRIGDRRTAAAAIDGLVEVIVETVGSGRSVTLTGFGVFEPRRRAARVARNPRTGETVPVPETIVPSFRPGAAFRDQIGNSKDAAAGATSAPRRAPRTGSGRAAAASSNGSGTRSSTTRSRSTRAAGTGRTAKSGTAKTAAAKTGASSGTTAKAAPAKKTPAADTGTKTPAKRTARSKAAGT